MALVVADRVQETTATTGTGTITLAGAVSGFQSFATIGDGNTTYYCVTSGTAWEVGIGTYTASGTTLARTTILASSAAGAAITLAGTSNVFCVYPASKAVYEQNDGSVGIGTDTPLTSILSGTAITVEVQNTDPLGIGTANAMFRAYDSLNSVDCCMIGAGGFVNAGVVGTFSGFPLAFYADSAEAMRITTTGRVGIGTTTPSQPLDVIGTVKATTFSGAGAFTTLSASSTVSGTGFSTYLASPPAIGGTTPAAGTFTTLIANTSAGVGAIAPTATNFYNAKNITGATTAVANSTIATIQNDVTVSARGYLTTLGTAASTTLANLQHYAAIQGTFSGTSVTNQFGFNSNATLIGAGTNYAFNAGDTAAVTAGKTAYGFYSGVNTASGGGTTYAFYAQGTAPNVFTGTVNIGSTGLAGANFYNAKSITGATTSYANHTLSTVQSDVTGSARAYSTFIGTAAAAFTLSNLQHFLAQQGTIGASSTVTSQTGFSSAANLIGATSNIGFFANDTAAVTAGKTAYGFYSGVNTASGGGTTYAFYAQGTAPSVFTGTVNIGSNGVAGNNFYNAKTITGATTAAANNTIATIQSDVTAQARGYVTNLGTAASAFTLTALRHFYANQATIGAGSTVTSQIGFYSEQNLIGATNNYGFAAGDTAAVTAGKTTYGFHSSVNTATGGGTAYGFYAAGTAPNVFVGTVNIGTFPVAGTNFYNAKTITGATSANACAVAAVVQSDVTSAARGYSSLIATAAASFSTSIQHFYASQSSIGAGSTVTSQFGFLSESNLIGATNNYAFLADNTAAVTAGKTAFGFYSNVNTATGGGTAYGVYAAGTAPNVFVGTVNIGALPVAGTNFYNAKNITGAVTANANATVATVQSDVTSSARGYATVIATAAASFSTAIQHFYAFQGTIGAGSTVTAQYGFFSESNLIGATSNIGFFANDTAAVTAGKTAYGFYSNVNTATGGGTAYGVYAAGTAPNAFAGTVNIGSNGAAGSNFYNAKNITGAVTANANATVATVQSDVTSSARGYATVIATAAASFSTAIQHFYANQGTIGAGSTVTAQYGFFSESNLIGATNNYGFFANNTAAVTAGKTAYGFYSAVNTATGGGTAWGFYAAGTANNYFGGNVAIGRATPTVSLDVNGAMTLRAPSTVNAATYTVAVTDSSLRFTTTNCTVTLPAAASFTGRILYLNTITANSVTSASSNVIPLGSNTAGTAIFAATAGKFAMIQSDGSNWITMMAN